LFDPLPAYFQSFLYVGPVLALPGYLCLLAEELHHRQESFDEVREPVREFYHVLLYQISLPDLGRGVLVVGRCFGPFVSVGSLPSIVAVSFFGYLRVFCVGVVLD
jgi:hypothetical protein